MTTTPGAIGVDTRTPARRRTAAHISDVRWSVVVGLSIATAYLVTARLGFQFAVVAEQVTTVWLPTGIAMAALLIRGLRMWPAIWIGAFAANALTDAPLWTAAAVASGNTLEAVAGAWALHRIEGFDYRLRRVRDTLAFIVLGAGLSTAVSATVGVATLCLAGVQPWARFVELWGHWWLGDAVGALVAAPIILTGIGAALARGRAWERALIVSGAVIATYLVFGQVLGPTAAAHPLEYVIFPFVIAAAVRYGQPTTALVVGGTSAVTIWYTVQGAGPFAVPTASNDLLLLQVFMGVVAGTSLLLAAALAERDTGDRRRTAAHGVGEVLADARDLSSAAPDILQSLCQRLQWQTGALWLVDSRDQLLRCLAVWTEHSTSAAFVGVTQTIAFPIGIGLPGRVWASGRALWITNIIEDTNFPRAAVARESGLHAAFGFPICLGTEVLGVIECFHRTALPPDPDLLRTMSAVGNQVGQFIGRKREETSARDEQRRTAAIVETALDAVIGMDHRGMITEFNPAAVRIFGYSTEAALGRELADLLIPSAVRDAHRDGLSRYLATGQGRFIDQRVETLAHHADGHDFPVEIAIARVRGEEPPRFTGLVRDLTARKEADREREHLLLREATARREAEMANQAKDEFLATLSHELRTPLNAIVGWTRMLLDGALDAANTRKALEVIDRNAHLQAQLVADILDVSRIITGGLRLDMRPVDLDAVVAAALDAIRPAAEAKRIQLRSTRAMTTGAAVHGDAPRLQQIVWNLVANAVKFTPTGGTVDVELRDADANVLLRVQDNGIGIDPDFLPFVFERFRQGDGSASRRHGGLGLGLAIVRHLVELHGGTVRGESPGRNQGSTFIVLLPKIDGMPQ
jgi:PAS domain S-box-containing protein